MMPAPPQAIGVPEVVAGILVVLLNAYVLMGGADFGGGTWDLLASGPRQAAQRELIAAQIGPIWEANHVWLVVAVVVLFTAFPAAFSGVAIILHVPIALMLIGIVLRGSAFVFRGYGGRGERERARWGRVFAVASAATPVLLGIVIGAISTDATGRAIAALGSGSFTDEFVRPWLAPFPVAVGVMALALFAQLAAVYLALAARDGALREDFRRRALGGGAAAIVAACATLALAAKEAPFMHAGVTKSTWSLPLIAVTGIAAALTIWALWRHRFRLARATAAAEVSLVLWGWAAAQYPFLVPPAITIRAAAAPNATLQLLLWVLACGAAVLVPSLAFLLRTFARTPRA
ncbi:MAG: cytochrome d ubiquinol oxidase subunit II [Gemmatimonadales bacterium]